MKRLSILFFVLALLLAGVTVMAMVVRARGLGIGTESSARFPGADQNIPGINAHDS